MLLSGLISDRAVLIDPSHQNKWELLGDLAGAVYGSRGDWPLSFDELQARIHARECQITTGLEQGIALPHGPLPSGAPSAAAFALLRQGIDFASLDARPAHFVLLLVFSDDESGRRMHLELLSRCIRIFSDETLRGQLMAAAKVDDVLVAIAQAEARLFPNRY